MSTVSALGSGPTQSAVSRAVAQDGGRGVGTQTASASGNIAARLPVVDPVTLSPGSVGLSQQAVNTRLAQIGTKTVDIAQKFINKFASELFGDAADGATFHVQTVSLEADASLNAAVQQTGSGQTSALSLSESAHFIGQGQIVTEDGQTYAFEIEVNYQASVAAAQSSLQNDSTPDLVALTGKHLPQIKFPGSLADLFRILGRQLDATTGGEDHGGNLSLRLLRLVNTAALLAPRAQSDATPVSVAEQSKAAASYSAASEIAAD